LLFVVCYLVLSCLVLSCLALSCLVLCVMCHVLCVNNVLFVVCCLLSCGGVLVI
jgi:hypothetical protein